MSDRTVWCPLEKETDRAAIAVYASFWLKGTQRKEEGGELWLVVRTDFRGMCQSSGSPWALPDDVFSSHLYSEI